ncbi:MAG: PilZ domain-containing protein [Treponema sp.]|jgi:hypothetical protein|nr:PilZ domain-containing protein [Treponema sp.]
MSTMVQGVEKEFLLKSLYNEQVAIICRYNRAVYTLQIEKLDKNEMSFKSNQSILGLTSGNRIDLTADYKGVVVVFVVEVSSITNDCLVTTFPDLLYKNLDRAYPRVHFPTDMRLRFSFTGERYFLPFSPSKEHTKPAPPELLPDIDLTQFNDIVAKFSSWVKESEAEHKLILFKEAKPVNLEEQILIKTGKALFLPSITEGLPETDPDIQKRVITKELFLQYLEGIGILSSNFDAALEQFIKAKQSKRILAETWVPLGFKEYVIGYIHFWITKEDNVPLAFTTVETIYQYADTLVGSLQEKQYFDAFSLKDKFVSAQGVDISAGGIRFSYPKSYISDMLLLDTEIIVKLVTPKRTINIKTKVLRKYEEKNMTFYGCHFLDVVPEDIRFLYEYIYGKPFTDSGGNFF